MEKRPQNSLHLRFNAANDRHQEAAAYLANVKAKHKTALVTAAIEAYRQSHPFGVDYQELEVIQKQTWRGFKPKSPIQDNLRNITQRIIPKNINPPQKSIDSKSDNAIDRAIDLYDLDDD